MATFPRCFFQSMFLHNYNKLAGETHVTKVSRANQCALSTPAASLQGSGAHPTPEASGQAVIGYEEQPASRAQAILTAYDLPSES